jgi:hypothetical protein
METNMKLTVQRTKPTREKLFKHNRTRVDLLIQEETHKTLTTIKLIPLPSLPISNKIL